MSVYQEIRKSGSIRRGDRRRTKREAAKMGFSELKSQTGSAMEELSVELALKHIEEEMELEADRLAGAAKVSIAEIARANATVMQRVRDYAWPQNPNRSPRVQPRQQNGVRVSQLPVGARAHGFGYDGPSFAAQRHIHQSLQARRGHCRIHTGRHM